MPYIDLFDVRKCIDSEIERTDIRDKSTRTIVVIVFFYPRSNLKNSSSLISPPPPHTHTHSKHSTHTHSKHTLKHTQNTHSQTHSKHSKHSTLNTHTQIFAFHKVSKNVELYVCETERKKGEGRLKRKRAVCSTNGFVFSRYSYLIPNEIRFRSVAFRLFFQPSSPFHR